MRSSEKVAVITGATGGIGSAIARALSKAGYALVLNAPSNDKLSALAVELECRCIAVPGNLRAESMPQALLTAALQNYGRCDICFNNSGLLEAGSIETIDIEAICNMVRVNVEGAFRMAYTFLQYFVRQGSGHLVNTSSILGQRVRPTVGAYAATKYALDALTEALRLELARTPVRISCVEPGMVRTGIGDRWESPASELTGSAAPSEPEELARMVLAILEPPARTRAPQRSLETLEPVLVSR